MSSRCRRTSAPDDGFTLVEMVVSLGLMAIVVTSMLTLFSSVQTSTARQADRSAALDDLRVVMDRLTKEARQAETIRSGSGAAVLDMDTYVNGVAHRLVYAASGTTLTRKVDTATAVPVLSRLSSVALFTYLPSVASPTLISVTIRLRTQNNASRAAIVSLTSDVRLRNG